MSLTCVFELPTRVVFGKPAIEALSAQLALLHARRALLISDPGIARTGMLDRFVTALTEAGYPTASFTDVTTNPTGAEVGAALARALEWHADAVVALGGGSPIDVAKAVAMLATNGGELGDYQWSGRRITQPTLPLLAIPTTAGTGSEVSKTSVILDPERGIKRAIVSPHLYPYAALLDPELTRPLPPWLTAATGLDAFSHALEAYVGQHSNLFADHCALAALEAAWGALPGAVANGEDLPARGALMMAALWGGYAMDIGGLGLVHALSSPLTAHLGLHHGLTNALLMPYVIRYNLPHIPPERTRRLTLILGTDEANLDGALQQMATKLGMPRRLRDTGADLTGADWNQIAEETVRSPLLANNPRPTTVDDCRALLSEMM
jgi:4-hydroxybutyrate dehydrogenase